MVIQLPNQRKLSKLQILTLEELEPVNVWDFHLESDYNCSIIDYISLNLLIY